MLTLKTKMKTEPFLRDETFITRFIKGLVVTFLVFGFPLTGAVFRFQELYFSVEPSDIIALKDSPASFNCSVSGHSSPVYEWRKDDVTLHLISDSRRSILKNGSLYISRVQHSRSERPDEGLYQCVASVKDVGTIVSKAARLQVANLPRFDEQPSDLTIFPGQTAYFPCSIHGIPQAHITWFKDDRLLQLDPKRMVVLPSGALEISTVQISDSGSYYCNASNVERSRISATGRLAVVLDYDEANKLAAPQFVATPRSIIAIDGSIVTLDCAANGNPKPIITWLKDGATVDLQDSTDARHQLLGIGSLLIDPVQEGDDGTYMCRAENHVDSLDASATVEVQVPPRFTKKPESRFAYEKEDVELECEVYGKPEPSIHWLKNGDIIVQSEYFQLVNGYNLKVLGLVRSDSGVYQCFATNPSGAIQASAHLLLLQPAVSPFQTNYSTGDQPQKKDVPTAARDLSAVIVSTRFVTLSWSEPVKTNGAILSYSVYYREEKSTRERVLNTTRPRLEEVSIQGLQPAMKYRFRVVPYNQHGSGASSDEIVVETQAEVDVPGPVRNLQAIALSPVSVHVSWEIPDANADPIKYYKIFYVEEGISEEKEIQLTETTHILTDLKKYTNYNIWIVAFSENGPGISSEETTIRTHSDVPSDTPQNVTLEAASSSSVIVRWEPPPHENQNGIITGYKIRYKLKGSRRGDTVTTDGNRRLYALTGLEKGAQYNIKIAAMTINGTGPATDWIIVDTYQNDLDESRVPDQPSSLRARPTANSITVNWTPPRNQNIMIRGYTIGWGIGFPDVYTKVLDGKQRFYVIENLQPSSEYVISLRAFNQVGDGRPIYETVKTLIQTTPEPLTPMLPPVGLKAIVLSSSTVVVYWTDTTLPRSQIVTDNRYYTVRYTPYTHSGMRKYRYYNSTDLNCMIGDLKADTQYEFSVKVTKGRRESTWSMSVINKTQETSPSSPPRDLTVSVVEDDSTAVLLQWQPPKQPNGLLTGFVIFYTIDNTQKDRDWIVESVPGDKSTATLKNLQPDATYFFKIQARNSKGYGPLSTEVSYKTPIVGLANNFLYIVIAAVSGGIVVIILIIVVSILCRRRNNAYLAPVQKNRYGGPKTTGRELKPPDLWIHHDQMELKEKGRLVETPGMTRSPHETDVMVDVTEKKKGSYIDEAALEGLIEQNQSRVNSFLLPPDSLLPLPTLSATTPVPNGGLESPYEMGASGLARPMYPRTQYNIPHAHVSIDPGSASTLASPSARTHHPYDQVAQVTSPTLHISLGGASVLGTGHTASYSASAGPQAGDNASISGTLSKRGPAHSLKSFSVPAPPCQSAPTTPQPRHIVRPQQIPSPQRKVLVGNTTSPATPSGSSSQHSTLRSQSSTIPRNGTNNEKEDQPSYSNEDLNAEMANLEGLMKDLNAITASEFDC